MLKLFYTKKGFFFFDTLKISRYIVHIFIVEEGLVFGAAGLGIIINYRF